jgi:protein-tyrosine phosphatase
VPLRICFVCSGNICRSPTAEVVLREQAAAAGRVDVVVESSGIGPWHVGDEMDGRARSTLVAAGYRPGRHAARRFAAADFDRYDTVVALDRGHAVALERLAAQSTSPADARAKIVLLRAFDASAGSDELDVPDPYYDAQDGFDIVLRQVERGCAGLLAHGGQVVPGVHGD